MDVRIWIHAARSNYVFFERPHVLRLREVQKDRLCSTIKWSSDSYYRISCLGGRNNKILCPPTVHKYKTIKQQHLAKNNNDKTIETVHEIISLAILGIDWEQLNKNFKDNWWNHLKPDGSRSCQQCIFMDTTYQYYVCEEFD